MPAKVVKSILVLCLLAVALPVASAAAKTVEKTVPGELVFAHGQRPGDPGNCSGVVFAQWTDVPGTVGATGPSPTPVRARTRSSGRCTRDRCASS